MVAISRSKVNIYIVAADTDMSSLNATDIFKGDIKSYSASGGEKDVESDPVFGGYVDKEKPITQVELGFEIVPLIDADKASRWDELAYTTETIGAKTVYTMSTDNLSSTAVAPTARMVVIEAVNGTDYTTVAYNNCNVTVLDLEHNADDNRTYNMTMKFSPTTDDGVSNFMSGKLAATALPNWSQLNNN